METGQLRVSCESVIIDTEVYIWSQMTEDMSPHCFYFDVYIDDLVQQQFIQVVEPPDVWSQWESLPNSWLAVIIKKKYYPETQETNHISRYVKPKTVENNFIIFQT